MSSNEFKTVFVDDDDINSTDPVPGEPKISQVHFSLLLEFAEGEFSAMPAFPN